MTTTVAPTTVPPTTAPPTTAAPVTAPPVTAPPTAAAPPPPPPTTQAIVPFVPSASYANCTEARNAGVTPLYAGDPGYAPKLDRDGDGIACE
ncbi:MAG TPA: excalibur calcium-binding domain-containing protein [Aquihabitans sp.]|nr:excalibur calcium-binding domain-containing protein [Aquihabitans sp.]